MRVLLVDAFDSFVYVVKNYVDLLGVQTDVARTNQLPQLDPMDYDAVILGPGPGRPEDAGYLELLDRLAGQRPVFGICLGMQAIGEFFQAEVTIADQRRHGKTSLIDNDGRGCFTGLPDQLEGARYHSLVVDRQSAQAAPDLEVSAIAQDDGYVMGLRHRRFPIEGVQFHPESIASQEGRRLIANFFDQYCRPAGLG
ncbi:aminodeoxychorismate/anthranilate synthase component II [Bifidobacterium aemilianum]|uniref:Aminodeoxychorismate/anthranilate synthase component II n=1 Tax=Bifidobacterium aemilianum TaxID=2493120 RepID=A0A366K9K5_9BIFI|nr:aminodeoxychorismate/anthranilate synthase component II [Bifidobacterium aemilianum]RBP97848.1 aminodeoxychorismate/anthranilate synthase component II [Bifidobacterium aemilianum]